MNRLNRRHMLQIGCSSMLGLSLPRLAALRAAAPEGHPTKSVILVFQTGGGSHIDSFDPKPENSTIKGEFSPISTTIPGVQFTEHVSRLAARTDKLAIIRSLAHGDNRHLSGTHNTLTGMPQVFRGNSNEDKELSRLDWPCYGGALEYFRPSTNGLPGQVTVPQPLIEGQLTWPGQHSGFLGPKFDPLQVNSDPNDEKFRVEGIQLLDGITTNRLTDRKGLLSDLNRQKTALDNLARKTQFTSQQEAAFSMLASGKLTDAFDLNQESAATRDLYGRSKMGQSLLLARRLVEHGVPYVQANMGHVQSWDTHSDNFPRLKDQLLPGIDIGVSALLDDLEQRGMLDDVLVIVVGEFGRTPSITKNGDNPVPGRGHWAPCYTGVFAGGGVRGGQVIGKSDKNGGYPASTSYHPNDIGATIYHTLGVRPDSMIVDAQDRPIHLNRGKVLDVLYTG
jgi:hypothetical protein